MPRDWRAEAAAAEEFFDLCGGGTVDQGLANIAATARALLADLKAGTRRHQRAAINRWAVRHLDLCARTFCRPPPVELVSLVEHQLGVAGAERDGNRKNREKFIAAAHHVAQYPDATPAQIARSIKYDQKRVIATWLEDPEFKEIVGMQRRRLAHQQKGGT
jgi:hypothetical protein